MHHAKLTVCLVTFAMQAACDGMSFAGGVGGAAVTSTGYGADTGGSGLSGGGTPGTGGGYDGPQISADAFDTPLPIVTCPIDVAGVLAAPRPTVIDAPRKRAGYSSAQYARHVLLAPQKRLPEPGLLRPDDFIAYYGDRGAIPTGGLADGRSVDVHFVLTTSVEPFEGYLDLRVRRSAPATPAGAHFVVLADVSPSMTGALALEKSILVQMGGALTGADLVSLVTFAGGSDALLIRGSGAELSAAAESLDVRAGHDLEGGLKAAVQLAQDSVDDAPDLPAEVILLTDGGTEFGASLAQILSAASSQGVRTSAVQLAKGDRAAELAVLNAGFLQGCAESGGGATLFIAGVDDAKEAFFDRFSETFRTAFADTTLSVTLPGGFASKEVLGVTGVTAGSSGGYARWQSARHRLSICPKTKDEIGVASQLWVDVAVLDGGTQVGLNTVAFDDAFTTPSVGARLEDAIVATVQYLREGAVGDHLAADAAIQEARARALCVDPTQAGTDQACQSLDELESLLAATQEL